MKSMTPLILIIVSVGLFFAFVDPQYKEVQVLLEEKQENDQLLVKARELREKRQELMARYSSISEEEREMLKKILPETVDNVRLIRDINTIAANPNNGMILKDISITGGLEEETDDESRIIDQTDGQYGTITLSFSTTAPYDIFKNFVGELENSLRVVDITALRINNAGDETEGVYDYDVTLDTYWLR